MSEAGDKNSSEDRIQRAVRAFKKVQRKEYEAQKAESKLHDLVMRLTPEEVESYILATSENPY